MSDKAISVLVVEDEALIRLATAAALYAAGYEVAEASDASEAIRILEARPDIRLVVTDVHMPGTIDGIKLAHYIRDKWPPIRLIVVSGVPGALRAKLPDGALFLTKPLADDQLVESVAQLLEAPL